MKKIFALILAAALMLGCTALAEENTFNWEEIAPQVEAMGLGGQFYTFEEIALQIFIPDGFVDAAVPDDSHIGYFQAEDGSTVGVMYVPADGMDLDTYASKLEGVGAADIEKGVLNGMPCVTYEMPEKKSINIAFATEAGYILEAYCGPINSEEEKVPAGIILASIQPYTEEAE